MAPHAGPADVLARLVRLGKKASIMLTGQQAKGFMAALEKAMTRAGLLEAT